jgi:zinc transporter ZupT
LGAVCGVVLESVPAASRRLLPFGGGMLVGVAIFWVLPEMAEFFRWPGALLWIAIGCLALAAIDRFVYPLCPACSPAHDHDHCATRLHGFAMPLLAAAALHSFLDGWTLLAAGSTQLGAGFVVGIAAHKVPEGLALGVIARAALNSRTSAITWCALAEAATLLGAATESLLAPFIGLYALYVLLAVAGGSFLYLGAHAVHAELRRSGAVPTLWPALTGVAGSSMLRYFVH